MMYCLSMRVVFVWLLCVACCSVFVVCRLFVFSLSLRCWLVIFVEVVLFVDVCCSLAIVRCCLYVDCVVCCLLFVVCLCVVLRLLVFWGGRCSSLDVCCVFVVIVVVCCRFVY